MGWFGQAWVFFKGWLTEPRTQFFMWAVLYIAVFAAYFPLTAVLGVGWLWLAYWLTWLVALFTLAHKGFDALYEWRHGEDRENAEEARRESLISLGRAMERTDIALERLEASRAERARTLSRIESN